MTPKSSGDAIPGVDEDDLALFRQSVSDALPHEPAQLPVARPKPPPRARFRRADEARVLQDSLEDSDHPMDNGDHLDYCRQGVNLQILRRLRRGRYKVQAETDLHGLTVPRARAELNGFLAECLREGLGCVRIIHGKGLRSGNGGPVLKSKVARWLKQTSRVVAYTSARPVDGGTGALYVLLDTTR